MSLRSEPHFFFSFSEAIFSLHIQWSRRVKRLKEWNVQLKGWNVQLEGSGWWIQEQSAQNSLPKGFGAVAAVIPQDFSQPCFGLKIRLCKQLGFFCAGQGRVLTEQGCAVAQPHSSSGAPWMWCTCWECLCPACAKPGTQEGEGGEHVVLSLTAAWLMEK